MGSNRSLPFDLPGTSSNKEELVIPDKLYFRISEVSKLTGLEPYVLRYWETEFKLIKPVRTKSRHRLYKRKDLDVIFEIKHLLYEEKFTIEGARKRMKTDREMMNEQLSLPLDSVSKKPEITQTDIETIRSELNNVIEMVKEL